MKHRAWLLIPLGLALAGASEAQDIHKCVGDGAVAYQNAPCTGTQVDAGVLRLPGYADPPERDGAMAPAMEDAVAPGQPVEAPQSSVPEPSAPDVQQAFPFRTSIALGMTDDQVLNLPNWGRPTRIKRTGRDRDWREVWTYDLPADTRRLSFVDGRLASIDGDALSLQVASAGR
jgi:hypothetical protein